MCYLVINVLNSISWIGWSLWNLIYIHFLFVLLNSNFGLLQTFGLVYWSFSLVAYSWWLNILIWSRVDRAQWLAGNSPVKTILMFVNNILLILNYLILYYGCWVGTSITSESLWSNPRMFVGLEGWFFVGYIFILDLHNFFLFLLFLLHCLSFLRFLLFLFLWFFLFDVV